MLLLLLVLLMAYQVVITWLLCSIRVELKGRYEAPLAPVLIATPEPAQLTPGEAAGVVEIINRRGETLFTLAPDSPALPLYLDTPGLHLRYPDGRIDVGVE